MARCRAVQLHVLTACVCKHLWHWWRFEFVIKFCRHDPKMHVHDCRTTVHSASAQRSWLHLLNTESKAAVVDSALNELASKNQRVGTSCTGVRDVVDRDVVDTHFIQRPLSGATASKHVTHDSLFDFVRSDARILQCPRDSDPCQFRVMRTFAAVLFRLQKLRHSNSNNEDATAFAVRHFGVSFRMTHLRSGLVVGKHVNANCEQGK
mmetsp:Transcript_55182/g.81858  ORF Transcript_55182/g.81858 Transcript_55182/m.81858 type:complete len:207 (-) Transcript_55182:18-638(-)